ncbi:hypothetical protein [Dokdonella sp.]|uniref:hypothetical protein n=1 Tax=Dokdonella sp. TaxID=2291710 RepID=UPI00352797E4
MRRFCDIWFGVYLRHMPILPVILPRLPDSWSAAARFWTLPVSVFPSRIVVAQFPHRCIEQPFLRRKPAHRQ